MITSPKPPPSPQKQAEKECLESAFRLHQELSQHSFIEILQAVAGQAIARNEEGELVKKLVALTIEASS